MKGTPHKHINNEMPGLVSMVAFNGADILDITGPLDVFTIANFLLQEGGRK
jgi:hypothetical protein